jgi:archaellin
MQTRIAVMACASAVAVVVGAMLLAVISSEADKLPRADRAARSESEPAKREVIYAGVAKTRGTIELAGAIVVQANTDRSRIDTIQVDIVLSEGAESISFDDSVEPPISITYIDADTSVADISYAVTPITGDTDAMLEWPEIYRLTLDVADVARNLGPGGVFTLEFRPPNGSLMVIQRSLPSALQAVNELN